MNSSHRPDAAVPRWKKALAVFMTVLSLVPSYAAAVTPSTLVQVPPFTAIDPPANVFMMLDDSSSMGLYEFPTPPGITTIPTTQTVFVSGIAGDETGTFATKSFEVNTLNEFVLRAPTLNPLWYNPATRYRPWSNDGVTTTFPNANIGGTAYGNKDSAPDNSSLTQRDMRYIPGGTVKLDSGGGTLGPWNAYSDTDTATAAAGKKFSGHQVVQGAISFRYYGLPLEWGTANTSNVDGTITDAAPRDLFTRPRRTVNVNNVTGCFPGPTTTQATLQCRAGTPAPAAKQYHYQNCAGTTLESTTPQTVTCYTRRTSCTDATNLTPSATAPATLNCYSRRTSCTNATIFVSTTPQATLNCFQRNDCTTGTPVYYSSDPGANQCGTYTRRTSCLDASVHDYGQTAPVPATLNCWQRTECNGTVVVYATDPSSVPCGSYTRRGTCPNAAVVDYGFTNPGPLNCFQKNDCTSGNPVYYTTDPGNAPCGSYTRRTSCTNAAIANYGTTAPIPATITCYKRVDCSGTTVYFDTDPGPLPCGGYTRRTSCTDATPVSGPTDPGPLTCYQRLDCSNANIIFASDPGALICGNYTRRNSCADATVGTFGNTTNPGNLTCYQRTDCSGTVVYTTTDQGPLVCGNYTRRTSCTNSAIFNYGTTNPGPINCFQRNDCSDNPVVYTTDPGPLVCGSYTRRNSCVNSTVTDFGQSNPGSINCYQRNDCTGTTQYFTTDPGPLTCTYTRRASCADATNSTTTADPGPLTCYSRRNSCADAGTTNFASNPGTLTCPYQRATSCANLAVSDFVSDPGPLTCYTRTDCAGTTSTTATDPGAATCYAQDDCNSVTQHRGPGYAQSGPFSPNPRSCPGVDETPLYNYQTTTTNNSAASIYAVTGGNSYPVTTNVYNSTPNQNASSSVVFNVLTSPATKNSSGVQFNILTSPGTNNSTSTTFNVLTTPETHNSSTIVFNSTPPTNHNSTTESFGLLTAPTPDPSSSAVFNNITVPTSNPSSTVQFNFITSPTANPSSGAVFNQTVDSYAAVTLTNNSSLVCPFAAPVEVSCTTDGSTGPDSRRFTPAHFYRYNGSGDKGNPLSYTLIQIDRTNPTTTYSVVDAVTGVSPSVGDSKRTDCVARTSCTYLEEAQNFANWYTYYRNRLFAAIAVISQSMADLQTGSQQQLRIGYGRINYFSGARKAWNTTTFEGSLPALDGFANPGALVRGVRPFVVGTPERQQFFDWLFSLGWTGSTPNREAIDSVGRYLTYADNRGPWGATPGTNDTTPQIACRRNYTMLTTDGEWTNVTAGQPIISSTGPVDTTGSNPTTSDAVLGDTIYGSGPNAGQSYTYTPATVPQYTGGSSSQTRTLSDVTAYYFNHDLRPDMSNVLKTQPGDASRPPNPAFWQSMSTFIIGYGLSADMDTTATRSAIVNGTLVNWPIVAGVGTDMDDTVITGGNRVNDTFRGAMNSHGNFYTAVDVDTLKTSINSTFANIQKTAGAAGGIAVTSPIVGSDTLAFLPGYVTGDWTGSIKGYTPSKLADLAAGTLPVPTPSWNAVVPLKATRKVLTSLGDTAYTGSILVSSALALSGTQQTALANTSSPAQEILNYVAGDQTLELEVPVGTRNPSGKYRTRIPSGAVNASGPLGDIVNSAPLYSRVPDFGYSAMPSIGTAYSAYLTTNLANRMASVTVGANDGMLHNFKVTPNGTVYDGGELYAYIPRAMYPSLAQLATPGYAHRYYVDGPVVQGDAWNGSEWRHMIVGTGGAGPISLFAIDDTRPDAVGPSSVKWDIAGTDTTGSAAAAMPYIGHVLGSGIIGRIRTGSGAGDRRWVYIVGNGQESTSAQAALLVIDLFSGAATAIPVGATWTEGTNTLAQRNGMGGVTAVYDSERNISLIYAGDKQGNLWKFNFDGSTTLPSNAVGMGGTAGQPLFTAINAAGLHQPISAAPRVALHPKGGYYVLLGTGKLYDVNDTSDDTTQSLYGLWDNPSANTTITRTTGLGSDVVPLTVHLDETTKARSFDTNISWSLTTRGWYIDLTPVGTADASLIGERVVADPTLDGVTFTIASYAPGANVDPCSPGGLSYVYVLNLISGQTVATQTAGTVGSPNQFLTLTSGTTGDRSTTGGELAASLGFTAGSATGGKCNKATDAACKTLCQRIAPLINGGVSANNVACPQASPMRVWRQPMSQ